jgi:hypothetical protein
MDTLGVGNTGAIRDDVTRMEGNPVLSDLSAGPSTQTLAAAWDRLIERLPEDWSHLLAEIELRPEQPYELVSLTLSPLNPERCDKRTALRFRIGREFGYGASPHVARYRLGLLDEARVEGRLRLLQVLSQRRPVETQGPVWRLGGRSL